MSTRPIAEKGRPEGFLRLPDPPEPEDMNNWKYFNSPGNGLHLAKHLGNEDTTIISSEAYVSPEPIGEQLGMMAPDLIIAFNADPAACNARNGYVISEQGKPPDFVLEIGSESTGQRDATVKRDGYARLGILEYWRFDPSGGDYQEAPLAGDRLLDGAYQPIPIEGIDADNLQGYSAALNLYLRWERGQLGWYDPATGEHIVRFDDERAGRLAEREGRMAAEARAEASEARIRELEAELERRQQG